MGRSLYQKLPQVVSLNWQEAQRLVGRSLYQKLPQVVSSEEALLLDV